MTDFILNNEAKLRMGVFLFILLSMMFLEAVLPRKARTQARPVRWSSNLLLVVIDSLTVRILFPIVAVGVATMAAAKGWGVFNIIHVPNWLSVITTIIILDMMIYWQHVVSHKWSWLWRFHKVHHTDRDIDVTTALRFHPIEIVLSMGFKMVLIALIGAPVIAVIIFEIILNGSAMFNHANLRLPPRVDMGLRRFIVTPDMHRIHHSTIEPETNSNYGFSTSLWDRIFGSYTVNPSLGHDKMTIGLEEHQTTAPANLFWALTLPFKRKL
ncbi:MAG: sterol desaturase family protein [Litorimonas sp.]